MSATPEVTIVDEHGNAMFFCSRCRAPLTHSDFFELAMRLPDRGESRDAYFDAELLDEVAHERCVRPQQAAG